MPRPTSASSSAPAEELKTLNFDLQSDVHPVAILGALGREARVHSDSQIEKIAASIREFGFLVPLIIDADHRVLAGMGRLHAARKLGMSEVPCVQVAHLTPARKRAFVLAENQLASLSGFDKDILRMELKELRELDLDFDLTVIGMSKAEIEFSSLDLGHEVEEHDPAPPRQTTSRLNDVWLAGEHKLLVGDATQPASYARLLGSEKLAAIWTDPPFNVPAVGHITSSRNHRDFVMAHGEMSDREFFNFLKASLSSMSGCIASGGLLYCCMDFRHVNEVLTAGRELAFELLNICVWDKMRGGQGSFYRSQHELIVVFKVGRSHYNNRVRLGSNGRNRTNVWTYPGVTGGRRKGKAENADHPTPKNKKMVADALLDCTERGDLVGDPFGGGGSLLLAAEETGRRARLMDLDPAYVDLMVVKWQRFTGRAATLEATGETFGRVAARARTQGPDHPQASPGDVPVSIRVRRRPQTGA